MKNRCRFVCVAVSLLTLALLGTVGRVHGQETTPRVSHLGYQLSCSLTGHSVPCSPSCMACPPHAIDMFAVLDAAGRVQFSTSVPVGRAFTFVMGSEAKGRGHTLEQVTTSEAQSTSGTGSPLPPESYFFESTSKGLVLLVPPLISPCGGGIASTSNGPEPTCDLDYAYFRFQVELSINSVNHRIEFAPKQLFSVFPHRKNRVPWRLARPASIQFYSQHEPSSASSVIDLKAGQVVAFWQTDAAYLGKHIDAVAVISMWSPASMMKPVHSEPNGAETVDYDRGNVWLQVRANRRTGWIYGDKTFRAIGLARSN
jgi:hypothetical protein